MSNHPDAILGSYIERKVVNSKQHQQLLFGTTRALNKYYGYAALLLLNSTNKFDTTVSTAAVFFQNNKYHFVFNPQYLTEEDKTLDHIVFAVCHEGLHRALQHLPLTMLYSGMFPHSLPGVPVPPWVIADCNLSAETRQAMFSFDGQDFLPFDQNKFMIALDHIVNALLVRDNIGTLHPNWVQPNYIDLAIHTEEAVYALVYDGQINGLEPSSGAQDEFILINEAQLPPDLPKNQQSMQNAREHGLSTIIEGQKLIGQSPGELARFFEQIKDSQIDWTERLMASIMQAIKGDDETSFNRIDRRFAAVTGVIVPTSIAFKTDALVAALDTSGSVSDREMEVFLTEIAGIACQMRPRVIVVLPCDSRVHDAVYLETPDGNADFDAVANDVMEQLKGHVTGGGGTSFKPPFQWVEDNMSDVPIEALVYLTDGYGRAPDSAPEYPVYWVTTGDANFCPWGEMIKAEIK